VIEVSIEQNDGDAWECGDHVPEIARTTDGFVWRVDRVEEQARIARLGIDMNNAIGVPSNPGNLTANKPVRPCSQVSCECGSHGVSLRSEC
jgi:hypothetical protein